jgi:hypothetical protein
MDLEKCARCGTKWVKGALSCGACGWIPIGAGLKRRVKKPGKRFSKWVDPTKTSFVVWLGLAALAAYGLQRAGALGWAASLLATPRLAPPPEAVGKWKLTRESGKKGLLAAFGAKSGALRLDKEGRASLSISAPTGEVEILARTSFLKETSTLSFEGAYLRSDGALGQIRGKPVFLAFQEMSQDMARARAAGDEVLRMSRVDEDPKLEQEDLKVINTSPKADVALAGSGLQAQMDRVQALMKEP